MQSRCAAAFYGSDVTSGPDDPNRRVWQAMLTWRAPDISRMESVRVQVSGKRIRANGRIVAPATVSYTSQGRPDGITLRSPVADTVVAVDDAGFILDYPGLAERI